MNITVTQAPATREALIARGTDMPNPKAKAAIDNTLGRLINGLSAFVAQTRDNAINVAPTIKAKPAYESPSLG
jgi:hypothetical protein